MTAEGGVIDEEWRLNYVFDRTETLGTAWTYDDVCQCYDHKFDPVSQKTISTFAFLIKQESLE